MARPATLDSQKDDGAAQEPAREQSEPVESSQVGERKERRLTFDPKDLAQLEDLEVDDQAEDLNLQDFIELAERDPRMLYKVMAERWTNESDNFQRSIDKLKKSCERKIQTKDEALTLLIDERDELRQALERMTIRFTNMSGSGTAATSSRGPKIPDGKKLRDGQNPRYESWKIDVQGKLRALAYQYNTPESRILYVKSMCEGEAADHLMARMRDDAVDPYLDSDDMFEHLDTVYLDANREINAKTEFRELKQKTMRFQTFLSKFNLLALDAKKARTEWKEELYHKLNPEMKRAMIREANDPTCEHNEFVRACNLVANRLEQITKEEKSAAKDSKGSQAAKDDKADKPPGRESTRGNRDAAAPRAPRVPLSEEELDKLKENRLCFNCKQPGHLNRNCPLRKKAAAEVKAVEEAQAPADPENDEA